MCSCRKYMPPSICSRHKFTRKSKCLVAAASARSMAAASRVLARLKICHVLKALQAGEPISMYGFCWRSSAEAFSLFDFLLKSNGKPSERSTTVRCETGNEVRPLALSDLVCDAGRTVHF